MLIQEFLAFLSGRKKYSEYTVRSYSIDMKQLETFLIGEEGEKVLESSFQPDTRLIRQWIVSMKDSGLSSRSVNRKLACLRSYFDYVTSLDEDFVNPMLKITSPKTSKRKLDALSEDDILSILRETPDENDFTAFRDWFIINLLYATGIRRSELLSIKHSDIDLYNSYLRVMGKRNKERSIPLGKEIVALIRKYSAIKQRLNIKSEWLVCEKDGSPMSQYRLYSTIHKMLQPYNIKEKSPHVLRHTCATHLINEGAEINSVKKLLGHTSLAATEVYAHTNIELLKREYKKTFPEKEK